MARPRACPARHSGPLATRQFPSQLPSRAYRIPSRGVRSSFYAMRRAPVQRTKASVVTFLHQGVRSLLYCRRDPHLSQGDGLVAERQSDQPVTPIRTRALDLFKSSLLICQGRSEEETTIEPIEMVRIPIHVASASHFAVPRSVSRGLPSEISSEHGSAVAHLKRRVNPVSPYDNRKEFTALWRARQFADELGAPYRFFRDAAFEVFIGSGRAQAPPARKTTTALPMQ
jgi:hypothetical protein